MKKEWKNKGPTPWGGRGFLIIVVLEFKAGMGIIYIYLYEVVYNELFFRSMNSWYRHAQVNIWKKCAAHQLWFSKLTHWHVCFGSLSSAAPPFFVLKSWPNSCILLLILGTEPPSSHVQHEFGIQTTSVHRLDISRQPWLKTLWESAIWVSIFRPTSEKFLISILIAHLLDPKGLHPPAEPQRASATYMRTSATCQMLKWGQAAVTWKNSRPPRGVDPKKNILIPPIPPRRAPAMKRSNTKPLAGVVGWDRH